MDILRRRISYTNVANLEFNFDVEFCRPILPHNQILCLDHFNLIFLAFVIFTISAKLDPVTRIRSLTNVHLISTVNL